MSDSHLKSEACDDSGVDDLPSASARTDQPVLETFTCLSCVVQDVHAMALAMLQIQSLKAPCFRL